MLASDVAREILAQTSLGSNSWSLATRSSTQRPLDAVGTIYLFLSQHGQFVHCSADCAGSGCQVCVLVPATFTHGPGPAG